MATVCSFPEVLQIRFKNGIGDTSPSQLLFIKKKSVGTSVCTNIWLTVDLTKRFKRIYITFATFPHRIKQSNLALIPIKKIARNTYLSSMRLFGPKGLGGLINKKPANDV